MEKKNPVYFLRYEDLVKYPKEELTRIMMYLLELDDLTGTCAEVQIGEAMRNLP